jgi:hypothetical protein
MASCPASAMIETAAISRVPPRRSTPGVARPWIMKKPPRTMNPRASSTRGQSRMSIAGRMTAIETAAARRDTFVVTVKCWTASSSLTSDAGGVAR